MRPLVVGVGHPDRADDAIGLLVAERVRAACPDVDVCTVASPLRLFEAWEGRDDVVVVDAVRSGRKPGAVTVVNADSPLRARVGAAGSHGFGLAEAIELARAVGRLPEHVVVVGVEAWSFAERSKMSAPVRRAAAQATRSVIAALRHTDDARAGGGL
jgi:hydrogenase maturation protease